MESKGLKEIDHGRKRWANWPRWFYAPGQGKGIVRP